jgi:PST family polysaccharide transporter/teichuronic acid exporter
MIFRAIGNPIGSLIIATGKTKLEFYWNIAVLLIIPIFVFVAAQFNITMVAWSLSLASLLLFYPSWKLLVYKIIGGTFKEYVLAIITPKL